MPIPSLRVRASDAVEIMDGPDCDPERLTRTYADFRIVNAMVSGLRGTYRRDIRPALSATRPSTLLDIGSGGGDVARALARWAARDGLRLDVTAIDPDARAHAYATSLPPLPGVTFRRALSSDLVAEGARFDFVVSNHVLHHLSPAELGGLLFDSERLAGGRVLHSDIERGWLAYLGFAVGTWPFFRRSFIRPDGLTSIRRSFTAAELGAVLPAGWWVTREAPFRLVLRWEAPTPPGAAADSPRLSVPVEIDPRAGQSRPQVPNSARLGAAPAPAPAPTPGPAPKRTPGHPLATRGTRMRDVVIVGGGPVGILLGCLLAGRGIDVEVLEQRTEPSMRSRAIGIHPPSMRALEQIGVADEVIARAVQIREGVVRCDRKTLGRLTFEEAAPQYPFVVALPQYETEALLRRRFEALRPGGLRGGVTVTGLRDVGDHVELTADDGETIQARYVVAADGARSRMREAAGIDWTASGRGETYVMGDFRDTGEHGSTAVLFFERGGVVESFPLPNGRRRWVAMTEGLATDASRADLAALIRVRTGVDLPIELPSGPAGDLPSRLPSHLPGDPQTDLPSHLPTDLPSHLPTDLPNGPAPATRPGPSADQPSAFAVRQRLAGSMSVGRVAVVGDAAHEISPIGGQGMNLGWLDCLALAPALERALAEPGAAASVLADFDRRRRRAARTAVRQAGFNMAMGRPAEGARLRIRNALVRVLAVPPASGILARAFTMRWL